MAPSDGLSPLQSSRLSPLASERPPRLRPQCVRPAPLALRRMPPPLLRHSSGDSLLVQGPLLPLRESRFAAHLRPLRRRRVQVSLAPAWRPSLSLPELQTASLLLPSPQTLHHRHRRSDSIGRLTSRELPPKLSSFRPAADALQYRVRGARFVVVFQLQLTRAPFLRILNSLRVFSTRSCWLARGFASNPRKILCNSCLF